MNKKASEKIMSAWFFFIIIVVLAGEVFILGNYINSPVDVRPLETKIMQTVLVECLVSSGFVNKEVFESGFDIYSYCNLNKSVFEKNDFYFNISFVNNVTGSKERQDIRVVKTWSPEADCNAMRNIKNNPYSYCLYTNETYFFVNKTGDVEKIKLFILTVSDNKGVKKI